MKRSVTASGTARTDSQADVRYEREADVVSGVVMKEKHLD